MKKRKNDNGQEKKERKKPFSTKKVRFKKNDCDQEKRKEGNGKRN